MHSLRKRTEPCNASDKIQTHSAFVFMGFLERKSYNEQKNDMEKIINLKKLIGIKSQKMN